MGLGDLAGRHSELVLYRQAVYGCRDQAVPQVPETTVETPAKLPAERRTSPKTTSLRSEDNSSTATCTIAQVVERCSDEAQVFFRTAQGMCPPDNPFEVTQFRRANPHEFLPSPRA